MTTPKHVLLVTNSVTSEELSLIKDSLNRAKQENMPIKLSLVHVIPNLPTCYFNIPSMVVLAERYYDEAKTYLTTVGETLGVSKQDQWLITGRMKSEVLRLASKLRASFILASSSSIQDLHKTFFVKKTNSTTIIRNINSIVSL